MEKTIIETYLKKEKKSLKEAKKNFEKWDNVEDMHDIEIYGHSVELLTDMLKEFQPNK